jgi:hypothetical protein
VTTFILGEQLKKAVNNKRLEKKMRNFIGKNLKKRPCPERGTRPFGKPSKWV